MEAYFTPTELVGHTAAIMLIIGYLMKDMSKLRFINSLGCLFFIIYGFMLKTAWPIIIPNTFILTINIVQLLKLKKDKSAPTEVAS